MNRSSLFVLLILAGIIISLPATVHSQFVTIARKIKTMHTGQADIATVIIDAKTFRVYQAVIDTLKSNPKYQITSRKNAENSVEFKVKTFTVTLKVDSLANGLSQITVSASPPGDPAKQATGTAVETIMGVCHKAGIQCTLDKK